MTLSVTFSGQISPQDVHQLHAQGVRTIINNRPDAEQPHQPTSAQIAKQCADLGIHYAHIPVQPGSLGPAHVAALKTALANAQEPVFAFCASGNRARTLFSML